MSLVLGIETSCDETGIALYCSERGLLSHTLYSQINLHQLYGGVVPELASRDHLRRIIPLISECLKKAIKTKHDIDVIAYTAGPGLNGALLVGAGVANGLALALGKPVIPIHHLEGHILSPLLCDPTLKPPFIALLVSGGNSQIIVVNDIGDYIILGDTLDDAAGEAFDKSARLLDLPYPGGKYLADLAVKGKDIYKLPRPMLHSKDLNFSFSGLKTAVVLLVNKIKSEQELTLEIKQNIAASIEAAIIDVLVAKATTALKQSNIKQLVVCGGVSANLTLRRNLDKLEGIKIFYPPLDLCTDNGAMIAIAGCMRLQSQQTDYGFSVKPRWLLLPQAV